MTGIVAALQKFALSIGIPGLFVVAFLDSSFLSLPQINDLLLIVMVTQNKPLMVFYAASATLGSLAGCLVLYYLGQKGGEGFVQRRFGSGKAARAIALLQRHGVLAVLIPALLPPPAPFKVFVLLAGVAKIPVHRFALAIAIGRGIRYFGEAYLAVRYGDQAMVLIEREGQTVGLWLVALLIAAAGVYVLLTRRQARSG